MNTAINEHETTLSDRIAEELATLERDGMVTPERVVEYAANPDTALHSRFTWDDTEAAAKHRLWEARQILRVAVRYVGEVEKRPMRAYVSLGSDRYNGGGYRTIASVMSDADRRAELLSQAKAEARTWANRYRDLAECADICERLFDFADG